MDMNKLKRALKRVMSVTDVNTDSVGCNVDGGITSITSNKRSKTQTDIMENVFTAVLSQSQNGQPVAEIDDSASVSDHPSICSVREHSRLHKDIVEILEEHKHAITVIDTKLDAILKYLSIYGTDNNQSSLELLKHCTQSGLAVRHVDDPPTVPAARATPGHAVTPAVAGWSRLPDAAATSQRTVCPTTYSRYFQHSAIDSEVDGGSRGGSHRRDAVGPEVYAGVDADAHTAMIVHRTINDVARRKRNVIVSGLPEVDDDDDDDDRRTFLQLCECHLSFKPAVSDGSCKRLGQSHPDRPRRMLVRCGSEDVASALLQEARLLRRAEDPYVAANVFINPDLAPAEAKLAYERRQARRRTHNESEKQLPLQRHDSTHLVWRLKHDDTTAASARPAVPPGPQSNSPPSNHTSSRCSDDPGSAIQPTNSASAASLSSLQASRGNNVRVAAYFPSTTGGAAATSRSEASNPPPAADAVPPATMSVVQ